MHTTHLSDLKPGNQFSFENDEETNTVLLVEKGTNYNILFYECGDVISTISFLFYVDTERDDYVMVDTKIVENFTHGYLLNEESGITHFVLNDKIVCGNRFNVGNALFTEEGIITCKMCKTICLQQ